jgi:hypothetical protein
MFLTNDVVFFLFVNIRFTPAPALSFRITKNITNVAEEISGKQIHIAEFGNIW